MEYKEYKKILDILDKNKLLVKEFAIVDDIMDMFKRETELKDIDENELLTMVIDEMYEFYDKDMSIGEYDDDSYYLFDNIAETLRLEGKIKRK